MVKKLLSTGLKRSSLLLICIMIVMSVLSPITVCATDEHESKTVTIGWYYSDLFQEGMSDEELKSGYSYEYIQKIADYNGWKYKYVYGEWTELFAMLEAGDIDLLAGVSKTEERMDKILYPNEVMGYESYVLYKRADDRSLEASDYSTFSGKKLGGITDNLMTDRMEEWLDENHIDAEIVYYNGFEERDRDFADGKLDALVTTDNNVMLASGYSKLAKVGEEAYYLAVAKSSPDVLTDLNHAMEHMQDIEPFYIENLEASNYGSTMTSSSLSAHEEEWLNEHGSITIGYLNDYLPYCTTDNSGNVYGIITDVIDTSFAKMGISDRLKVNYVAYDNGDEMTADLCSGDIDVAFPVDGDIWLNEKNGIKTTNDVVTSNVDLVYKGTYSEQTVAKIAVNSGNSMMRHYTEMVFPDAMIVEYDSTDECMNAVLRGDVGATTINELRADIVEKNRKYNDLSLKRLDKTSSRCFGVATENSEIRMILNRGLKLIGQDFAANASYNYVSDLYEVTLLDFILDHLGFFGGLVLIIVAGIIFTVLRAQNKTKRYLQLEEEKNEELTRRQEQLEEATSEQEAQVEEINELNRQLREKQQYTDLLYQRLLKVQACGIVAYKVPSHEMLVMNDMARRLYDLPIDGDLDSREMMEHISKVRYDNPEITKARLHSIKNPGEKYSFSFWIYHQDGTDVHIYTTTQLIQMDNGDQIVISSMQDISEITELYRTTEQAKAANTAKTSFLFSMSHDIRTPMNAIIGYTDLIEKHFDDKEKCKDYLVKIKSSNSFLLSLINNVLEMARIESGKVSLDEQPCRTQAIIDEIGSVYTELMINKGIRFTQSTDVKTQYVFADPVKVKQVFLNIVSNAYKYTNAGGEVAVAIDELPSDREGYVLMRATISDTGIGMSEDYLPVLFEEFSREQSSTDSKIEGTGLGMPIVKRLVDLMEGTIEVDSELGKGTTFIVTIPLRVAEKPSDQNSTDDDIDLERFAGKRILLAEDNELNAEIATEVLTEFGFVVERAEDGDICVNMLDKAISGYYDVILMDIQMPNLDGYGAARQIRALEDQRKAHIPIIAMTANAFDEDKREAFSAGMNGHLPKPIDVNELIKTLARIIG